MTPILVFGAGGHAKVVIDIVEKQGRFRVAGILAQHRSEGDYLGYRILKDLRASDVREGVVAIGDNWTRARIVGEILAACPEFRFVTPVHPSTQLGRDVSLGPGTVVMAGVCINPGTRLGAHCIVNTRASLDHDNAVGDFASVAPGATTGGNVSIGAYSAIGIGATCLHLVSVGEHTVIGAGALVCRDVPSHVVAYGSPCRVVRPRQEGDPYLQSAARVPSANNE